MKKLLLILSAVFVSVMAWAASLNPYAYDLSSSWDEANSQLTVRFKLNAHPNMTVNNSGRGIQIFAIDPSNNNKQYYIYGVPGTLINEKIAANSLDYELTIPITGVTWDGKEVLPAGKTLTWAVNVAGLNKTDQASPVVVNDNIANRPYSPHGVAVNNDQNSPDFGSIYITECTDGVSGDATWGWLADSKGRSLLKYDPTLKYQTSYRKHKEGDPTSGLFSLRNKESCLLEPHRVRVSDDGRIFVSSYNRNTSDDQVAVWELKNGVFTPVIYHNTYGGAKGVYGDRVCGMAVKGSGSNLRILLCFLDEYDGTYANAFRMYEYDLNALGTKQNEGSWRCSYRPDGNTFDGASVSAQGALDKARTNKWYFYSDGFASVAYGSKNNNDVFLSIDYCQGVTNNASIVYFKEGATSSTSIQNVNKDNHYYGGGGFIPMLDGSDEYIISGRTKSGASGTHAESNGYIHAYPMNGTTISTTPKSGYTLSNIKSETAINDMAMDCANNLYAVSFTDGSKGTGRLIAIAMPYGGSTLTIAPSSNAVANKYFSIPPVPNIYATNLRYEAVEGAPKYKFSFNVNTTPKYAEIRFYKSYESMKKSMSAVNADDFKGGKTTRDNNLYCYYPISGLKQGKIEVEFGMVGGIINLQTKELTNACLPRGELYWSVYVETDKSSAFAPIYRQPLTGTDAHYHMHAIVNNYPETDQFGTIYGAQEDKRDASTNKRSSLMIYEINDNGSDVHDLNNTTRYVKKQEYLYNTSDAAYNAKPRRMDIAPDGTIYIAHEGKDNQNQPSLVASWLYGGIYAWNPNDPLTNEKLKLSLFSNNKIGTSSGVALYPHVNGNDTTWKMYAANSYGEFTAHGNNYTNANQRDVNKFGWNGFVEYEKGVAKNWNSWLNVDADQEYKLKQGDGSGNNSLVAMDKGVWICQHREHSIAIKVATNEVLADNRGSLVLSFVPYGNYTADADFGPRTWRSSTTDGGRTRDESGNLTVKDEDKSVLTQESTSILQATPGAGMAYRKINGVDYLFINNHDGDIVQLQVDWDNTKTLATPLVHVSKAKVLTTPSGVKGILSVNGNSNVRWKTAAVSSMCFDFAGNLVTTTGNSYLKLTIPQLLNNAADQDAFNTPEGAQSIIIYTMPYDRTNAREIQAPKSNIFIPERLVQLNMTDEDIQKILTEHNDHGSQCYIDLYRPMQGGMFNTFCVPFELNTTLIPTDHPLYGAEIRRFTGVTLSESGGEKILTLNFENLINNTMAANVPHIINPKSNIKSIIPFDWLQVLATNTTVNPLTSNSFDNGNTITYQGILPKTQVDALYDQTTNLPLRLILVADNRLAALTGSGDMYGFRGYFELAKPLPPGTVAKISAKKDTPTNTTIVVDGKKVNIEKYLREGRVYIRVGDSLYTIDGQVVE